MRGCEHMKIFKMSCASKVICYFFECFHVRIRRPYLILDIFSEKGSSGKSPVHCADSS